MTGFNWSKDENKCFGCGDNEWGLDLEFERQKDWIEATTVLHENFQGFSDVAHGGIVATLLDEAGAWAAMLQAESVAPSFRLDCSFKKPVPLQEEIVIRGWVNDVRHNIVLSESQVLSADGEVLASAKVKLKIIS